MKLGPHPVTEAGPFSLAEGHSVEEDDALEMIDRQFTLERIEVVLLGDIKGEGARTALFIPPLAVAKNKRNRSLAFGKIEESFLLELLELQQL